MKKIFTQIGRVVKKIAIPALAVAAIAFTGGAALGLPAMAGGWGGAVSAGLAKVGIGAGSTLGSVLTGAVSQAGYGAAIGGAIGAATGQGFTKGATMGALGGALTGGASGLLGAGGAAGAARAPAVTASSRSLPALGGLGSAGGAPLASTAMLAEQTAQLPAVAGTVAPSLASAAAPTASGLAGAGSLVGKVLSSPMAGQVIAGVGKGLMGGLAAKEDAQALEEREQRLRDSYSVDPGAYDVAGNSTAVRPQAESKWRRRVHYNRQTRQIEYS